MFKSKRATFQDYLNFITLIMLFLCWQLDINTEWFVYATLAFSAECVLYNIYAMTTDKKKSNKENNEETKK